MKSTTTRKTATNRWLTRALISAALFPLLTGGAFAADVVANWTTHCVACHGKDGKGQTKAGRMAGVKDQTDPAYQATLDDARSFTSIKEGLKDGGKDKMKPFKDKLSDDEIKALIAHVRSLKK